MLFLGLFVSELCHDCFVLILALSAVRNSSLVLEVLFQFLHVPGICGSKSFSYLRAQTMECLKKYIDWMVVVYAFNLRAQEIKVGL